MSKTSHAGRHLHPDAADQPRAGTVRYQALAQAGTEICRQRRPSPSISRSLATFAKLETALEKLAMLAPDQPEPRYDLAALQAIIGRPTEACKPQGRAGIERQRRAKNPTARDMLTPRATTSALTASAACRNFKSSSRQINLKSEISRPEIHSARLARCRASAHLLFSPPECLDAKNP